MQVGSVRGRKRMIEICDEWVDLVGEPAESTSCTTCARHAEPGEKPDTESKGKAKAESGDDGDEEGSGGAGDDENTEDEDGGDSPSGGDDSDADSDGSGDAESEGETDGGDIDVGDESGWGSPGADDPDADSDAAHLGDEPLSDEDAELMKMMKRDLEELMKDGWTRDLDTVELSKPGEWAAKVFGNTSKSMRLTYEEPTAEMRQHVVRVARELSNLVLPAVSKVSKASEAPPGRMRSREALRATAERSQGQMVTARPWRSTVRRHSASRPLVIGVATDTSGSMRWAEHAVAEFAYVYANAGHRIGARTAAVTFGDHVHRIARPNEVLTQIVRKTANDSTEEFDRAMAALDGVLHLTTPAYSARILFVISDGQLVKDHEIDRGNLWMQAMDRAGTHVVWITDHVSHSGHWLARAAVKYPRMTLRSVYARYDASKPSKKSTFDLVNEMALDAIRKDVSA